MSNSEIKKPIIKNYQSISSYYSRCGCDIRTKIYKENCYFYHEERDMCAVIPSCNYYQQLGYCPCEDCNKYVPRYEVYGMIKKIVDERNKDNG